MMLVDVKVVIELVDASKKLRDERGQNDCVCGEPGAPNGSHARTCAKVQTPGGAECDCHGVCTWCRFLAALAACERP